MELPKLRKKIDAIDRDLAKLLDKRLKISLDVAAEKIRIGKNVTDGSREKEVLENAASCTSAEFKDVMQDLFIFIMQKSKDI